MWYRVNSELTLFYMRCWMQRNLKQTARSLMLVAPTEMTHRGSRGSAIWEEMNSSARLMTITSRTTSTCVDWAVKCLTMIMLWIWFWMLNPLMVSLWLCFSYFSSPKCVAVSDSVCCSWYFAMHANYVVIQIVHLHVCCVDYVFWSFCTSALIG